MASINAAMYVYPCILLHCLLNEIATDFKSGLIWSSSATQSLIVTFYRDGELGFIPLAIIYASENRGVTLLMYIT